MIFTSSFYLPDFMLIGAGKIIVADRLLGRFFLRHSIDLSNHQVLVCSHRVLYAAVYCVFVSATFSHFGVCIRPFFLLKESQGE